jgi:hypothetical protein
LLCEPVSTSLENANNKQRPQEDPRPAGSITAKL